MDSRSLYRQLLGPRFEAQPPTARLLHARPGRQHYRGEVEVVRGTGLLSRLCGWATRLPPAGSGPIGVEIIAARGCERWTRKIAGHAMRSRLWAHDGLLCERLGLVTFGFRLEVADDGIEWRVQRVRAMGLPLPAKWFESVRAREFEKDARYRFDVVAVLPVAGLLVRYRGWLDVA